MPRTVLACLVGAALGLSGAVLQGLTRNPLADPGLLGVSAGAALGAVIALYTGIGMAFALAIPVLGLLGALGAAALTLALGSGGGTLVLVLAGAAVSGLMLAGTALVLNLAPNPYAAYEITHWMLGSLADRGWDQVWLTAPFILVGVALLLGTGRALDALSLGEQQAASLGVDLPRLRRRVLIGTALAVAQPHPSAARLVSSGWWRRTWCGRWRVINLRACCGLRPCAERCCCCWQTC